MALIFRRAASGALVIFFVAMTIGPLNGIRRELSEQVTMPQFDEIRWITRNLAPTAAVMDGYQGSGLYRPNAFFYWFLAYTDRTGISETEKQQLLQDLNSGSIAPRLILFDSNLKDFSPGVTEFLEKNYEPVGVGVIWKRKERTQASTAYVSDGDFR